MPLGRNAASSTAAIMQLERNAPDDIIDATMAGSSEFSRDFPNNAGAAA